MNTTIQQHYLAILFPLMAAFVTACAGQQSAPIPINKPTAPVTNEDLTAMKWQLLTIAQPGKTATARLNAGPSANRFHFTFSKGRLLVNGGCNNLSGAYKLTTSNGMALGPMAGTKKACQTTLMAADNEILSYLSGITDYSINGRALTLTTAFKQRLVLKGIKTASAKYGGNGVRKFIEIKNNTQGLRWREAKYNSNWIRVKDNAPWETVYPGIQGFVPESNHEYIVRIFEYTDPQAQQAIWVKDMVTMSGVLR